MMQSDILIRPLTEADLPRVLEIENLCFPDPWTEGIFRSSLSDDSERWFAAEKDGILLGYAGLQHVLDEGCVENIAVDPGLRRSGVGTALLKAMEAEAMSLQLAFLTLEVRVSNAPAIALYSRFGFQTLGKRPGYYLLPKEDALIMTKYYTL